MNAPTASFRAAILATLGHAPDAIEPGCMHRFSTNGRRGDDAGWCRLFDDMRGGVYGCHRQGVSETWAVSDRTAMTQEQRAEHARQVHAATVERQGQQRQQWVENAKRNARMWQECVPLVPGDPCMLYLSRRGLDRKLPLPGVLRLHRAMPYWHDGEKLGTFPAMVAPIVAPDGRTVALHRTFVTMDGHKADVPSPKKLTGTAGPLPGACVPLHQPTRGCIGIAEGIETALAFWCASAVPTVAAYCAANMASWQWPRGVNRLAIYADADKAGQDAAHALKVRATRAGLTTQVLVPTEPGDDWSDVWSAAGDATRARV